VHQPKVWDGLKEREQLKDQEGYNGGNNFSNQSDDEFDDESNDNHNHDDDNKPTHNVRVDDTNNKEGGDKKVAAIVTPGAPKKQQPTTPSIVFQIREAQRNPITWTLPYRMKQTTVCIPSYSTRASFLKCVDKTGLAWQLAYCAFVLRFFC
jgi:hypothetical protein